jgi:hypothetical protein
MMKIKIADRSDEEWDDLAKHGKQTVIFLAVAFVIIVAAGVLGPMIGG